MFLQFSAFGLAKIGDKGEAFSSIWSSLRMASSSYSATLFSFVYTFLVILKMVRTYKKKKDKPPPTDAEIVSALVLLKTSGKSLREVL